MSVRMDDLPIEHVRRPAIPWRDQALTECGLPVAGHPVITREEFIAKYRRQGHQRALLTTCQTCVNTARDYKAWEDDPISAFDRELHSARMFHRQPSTVNRRAEMVAELRAIAIIIARHREEFDELLEDQAEIVPLHPAKTRRGGA